MIDIKKKFTYAKNSKELFIIFPSLIGRFGFHVFLKRLLRKNNVSVLEYIFPKSILSADWKKVLDNFFYIKQLALSDIDQLKQRYGFEKINIVGVSIGCIYVLMTANNRADVKNLYLILPGHNLAETLWKGEHTQDKRKIFESNHVSLSDLKEHWHDLAPENNIDKLGAERILVFLTEIDKTIPFDHGKEFLEKLYSYNYPVDYRKTKYLRHWIAAAYFYLFPKKFI